MRFGYCLGSGNGTRSLRAGDFFFAGSSRGGGRCTKRFRRRNKWSKRGKTALVYLLNKQVSKNCAYRSVFQPVSFFFLIFFNFFHRIDFFLISYLIYSLSKKSDQEPNDKSADSVIVGIVEKILRESEIRGVVINSRILNVFRKKDFSPPLSVQESVKEWGEKYKEAY